MNLKLPLVLYKISSPGACRAVYKALHGVFTELSLVILRDIQEKRVLRLRSYYRSDAVIEAAQRSWAVIFCNARAIVDEI